jgi:hypothetical protein
MAITPTEKERKWKWESGTVEGGQVWMAFIGPEQCRDVEAGRWFWWPTTVGASMYWLREWRRAGRRGIEGVGC